MQLTQSKESPRTHSYSAAGAVTSLRVNHELLKSPEPWIWRLMSMTQPQLSTQLFLLYTLSSWESALTTNYSKKEILAQKLRVA